MTQLALEIQKLKHEVHGMWGLVLEQLQRSQQALHTLDRALAKEVVKQEKRVNSRELKIERHCEQLIALHTPVAIDLRLVLAVLKINTSLERIGDAVKAVARFVGHLGPDSDQDVVQELLAGSRLEEMCLNAARLLELVQRAFEQESSELARSVFQEVKRLGESNVQAHTAIADYIRSNPVQVPQGLQMLLLVRKLDRIGDEVKRIAEEIIFYLEARVLRHQRGKKRNP